MTFSFAMLMGSVLMRFGLFPCFILIHYGRGGNVAWAICRELSKEGAMTTCEAGSHLIMALCRAEQKERALDVFNDMIRSSKKSAALSRPWLQKRRKVDPNIAEQLGIRSRLGADADEGIAADSESSVWETGTHADYSSFKNNWRQGLVIVYPLVRTSG